MTWNLATLVGFLVFDVLISLPQALRPAVITFREKSDLEKKSAVFLDFSKCGFYCIRYHMTSTPNLSRFRWIGNGLYRGHGYNLGILALRQRLPGMSPPEANGRTSGAKGYIPLK